MNITQPNDDPYQSPERPASVRRATPFGLTVLDFAVIVVIVALLMWLILPFVQNSRGDGSSANRCRNQIRNIQLALLFYHNEHDSFPPAFVPGPDGQPAHSWRVLVLPYLDQQALYDRYSFDEPWNGPNNVLLQDFMPDVYRCPTFLWDAELDSLQHQHLSRLANYVVVVSPDALFSGLHAPTATAIPDGTGNTVAVAEVRRHAVHWMSPVDITPHQLLTDVRCVMGDRLFDRAGHLHVGFADGSGGSIPQDIPESDFYALISVDGGEDVSLEF